ncbi:MAG: diadenylate cyclase CdaA [Candidatus Aureabacteria bacterium]|nr:diadenylate cyclase CdaA [Candidatus Auribacterota bacterium]
MEQVVDFILGVWKPVTEIAAMAIIFYYMLLSIRGTLAQQVLKGIIIFFVAFILIQKLHLETINWILTKVFAISIIGFIIIFQPELRRALAHIGEKQFFMSMYAEEAVIDVLVRAVSGLSKKKIGALIAIEREVGLKDYIESGIPINSRASEELIQTIFIPNTPLHDGGVIITNNRLSAAGCLFPLSSNPTLSKTLGTRHRAAIGLSEETDAVVIVVSEETGSISVASNGVLTRDMDDARLKRALLNLLEPGSNKPPKNSRLFFRKSKR